MPRISQTTAKKRGSRPDSANGPKRTEEEALRDRADIARLRLDGLTQAEIAAEISKLRDYKISPQTVCNDLKEVRSAWMSTSLENYEQTRAIELARLDQEERFAIAGWERSLRSKVSKKERTRTGTNDGKPFEEFMQETDEEVRDGNPVYLARLESIRKRRCEILGFASWQKSEDINAAIMTLVAHGYIVRLPETD
jgi:transposase